MVIVAIQSKNQTKELEFLTFKEALAYLSKRTVFFYDEKIIIYFVDK